MSAELPGHLASVLDQLGYSGRDGLVTTADAPGSGSRDYGWRDLRDKVGLDAAFFQDGVPLVGFCAGTDQSGLAALRRRLWNYGRVPLLIATSPDSTTAFNAVTTFEALDRTSGVLASQRQASVAGGLLEAFSRREIESGGWASRHSQQFRSAARVDGVLLKNLRYLRALVPASETARRDALDSLIGGSLIASYLADRGILNVEHLDDLVGFGDLRSVLASGQGTTKLLFERLAEHFNGDVFGPLPAALSDIAEEDLLGVASLLRGDDLPSGQQALWPYDFSVLPADLVSTVYEQLLESSRQADAAYYTPRFLVDLVLDEVLPWGANDALRLADLSCGSGAFLSEAFRRLAYRESGRLGRALDYSELRQLLLSSVYGVDSNPSAARVAVFGLYLSLLDELDPPTIWASAVLPQLLGRNVVVADAFEDHELSGEVFDAVVGNPPWASRLSSAAAAFVRRSGAPVADRQLAQAFLWLASSRLQEGGTVALVMPAKALLHNRAAPARVFRAAAFGRLDVKSIVDLSAMRRTVFAAAIAPAAVIVARKPSEADSGLAQGDILHVAPHPRPMNTAVEALVITPEEIQTVGAAIARGRPDIWKVLLWGSARDLELLDRLRARFSSVEEVAEKRGWTYGQGYQVGGGDDNDASHMVGMPVVAVKQVLRLTLAPSTGQVFQQTKLHRPRDPRLFRGPLVIVRRTLLDGRLAAALVDDDVAFNNGMLGFAAPVEDRPILAALAATIVSSLGQYWHFLTSASWGVERDFVELNEHLEMPLPLPNEDQALQLEALTRAGSDFDPEHLDEIVFDMFGLSKTDRDRVLDGLVSGLARFRRAGVAEASVSAVAVSAYASTLRSVLNRTLPALNVTTTTVRQGSYHAVSVTLSEPGQATLEAVDDRPVKVDIDAIVEAGAVQRARTTGVVAQPAGFYVDDDTVYIVKTVDADRWSRNAALDDADRILAVLALG